MEKIKLSDDKSYYVGDEFGVVVSSFEEDVLFENECIKDVVLYLIEKDSEYFDLASDLSINHSPSDVFKAVNYLLSNNILENAVDTAPISVPNISVRDYNCSSSYFDDFLFGNRKKAALTIHENGFLYFSESDNICLECYEKRLLAHRPILNVICKYGYEVKKSSSVKEVDIKLFEKLFSNREKKSGDFYSINKDGDIESFKPLAFSNCNCCKQCDDQDDSLLLDEVFGSKLYSKLSYRSVEPEVTIEKLSLLVNPYVGIISKLTPYREINKDLIFNYSSGRNLAFSDGDRFWLKSYIRSSNGGKGKSPVQAKAGALAEAVERYSMVYQGGGSDLYTSFIAGGEFRLINPESCLLFSDDQYNNNSTGDQAFHQAIPHRFDKNKEYHWHKALSLTYEEECYLPGFLVYAKYNDDPWPETYAYPDSNGCSAGNNYAEAVLQGTLELLERDAAAIWWYNKCLRKKVDLKSLGSDYIESVIEYYSSIKRDLYVLDITTDIGIPCFVAVSYSQVDGKGIIYGFGCHLDCTIAIERAIVEVNQLLPIVMTKRSRTSDQSLYEWLDNEVISDHEYLRGDSSEPACLYDYYSLDSEQKEEPIRFVVQRLESKGIELILFDLKQADTDFPVVKMIAPGLRHFWRRTGPGRLYDVPVKMGWVDKALDEKELNSHSITI